MTNRVEILPMADKDLLGTTEEALVGSMESAQANIDALEQAIEREKAQIRSMHVSIQRRRELIALQEKGG